MKYYNISHFTGPRLVDELVIYDTGEKPLAYYLGLWLLRCYYQIENDNIILTGYVISGHGKGRKYSKGICGRGRLSLTGKGSG